MKKCKIALFLFAQMCKIAHWAGLKMCKILGRPPVKHFPFTLVQFTQKIRIIFSLDNLPRL